MTAVGIWGISALCFQRIRFFLLEYQIFCHLDHAARCSVLQPQFNCVAKLS